MQAMFKNNCTCEYCCFVRDENDDKEMAMEYDVAMSCGKDVFDSLNVGDLVEYYRIPYDDRKVVHLPENIKWKCIEEIATKKFQGIVDSKTEYKIEVNKNKISPAECWAWGLRKI